MNKRFSIQNLYIFILFFILLLSNLSYSQTAGAKKFKQPYVNIDILFAYSQPLPSMFGNIQDFFDFKNYGVKYGLGSQIDAKICANKKGTIKPYLSLGYSLFLGSANSTYIDSNVINNGFPLPGSSKTYGSNQIPGTSKIYLHDFYVAGGFEYDFVNKTRWTPYLGAELNMNILFGTYRQTQNYALGGGPSPGQTSFTIKSAARFGIGAAAGIYLRIHQIFGFTFATKYKFANILGKSSDVITEQNKMTLLDKAATNLNTNLSKSRNIDYFEFLLGVSFFIGKR